MCHIADDPIQCMPDFALFKEGSHCAMRGKQYKYTFIYLMMGLPEY